MRRLLTVGCLSLLAACGEQATTAPDVVPQFLIGNSPLSPIELDKSGVTPLLLVPVTVNRGIAQVAIEDKFKVRVSGEFKLPDGGAVVGPQDFALTGQKDTGVRDGSDVGFIMDMDIPAPTWDAIKDLDQVSVELLAELVMTTGSGSEKVLDSVELSGTIIMVFVTSIAVGHKFTCALDAEGQAYCWGSNSTGEVGDGTTTDRIAPTPVAGGLTFTQLATSWRFACGLSTTGQAYCWGSNSYGQLGDGTTIDRVSPTAVQGGHTFQQITASPYHACALTTEGQAYCWGSNSYRKLGDGTTTNSPVPVPVVGGLTFLQLGGGYDHNCGVTATGEAYCWGSNGWGQIGDGDPNLGSRGSPTEVLGGLAFQSVTAGDGHTCGLTTDGQAYCWGANTRGQLGDGSLTGTMAPVAVSGGFTFEHLAANYDQTCAATVEGQAYCWGFNSSGQLGDGTTTVRTSPTAVVGGLTFRQVEPGAQEYGAGGHTCGLASGGLPYCWGENARGQLGDGTTTMRLVPTPVLPF